MIKSPLAALLAGVLLASTPLIAQDEGGGQGRQRRAPSPVKVEMEKLDEAFDAVIDFLKNPEGDAPMATIAAAQEALHKAKQEVPRTAERQPEDQRAAFVIDYKVQMNKTIRGMLDLEDAMLAKNWQAAGKVIEELKALQKEGHQKFKPQRRRRGAGGGEGGGEGGGGN